MKKEKDLIEKEDEKEDNFYSLFNKVINYNPNEKKSKEDKNKIKGKQNAK